MQNESLHPPVNPCVLRTAGLRSKKSATFGMVRKNKDGTPRAHQGVDFAAEVGQEVYAVADGVIVGMNMADDNNYGLTLTLRFVDSDEGTNSYLYAFYAHLNGFAGVWVGMPIRRGERVGYVGDSGNAKGMNTKAKGCHLHFEIRTEPNLPRGLAGRADPLNYIEVENA